MGQLLHFSVFFVFSIASFNTTAQYDSHIDLANSLIEAVQRVSYSEVTQLIEAGADVTFARADGSTALSWAAQRPDAQIVTAL